MSVDFIDYTCCLYDQKWNAGTISNPFGEKAENLRDWLQLCRGNSPELTDRYARELIQAQADDRDHVPLKHANRHLLHLVFNKITNTLSTEEIKAWLQKVPQCAPSLLTLADKINTFGLKAISSFTVALSYLAPRIAIGLSLGAIAFSVTAVALTTLNCITSLAATLLSPFIPVYVTRAVLWLANNPTITLVGSIAAGTLIPYQPVKKLCSLTILNITHSITPLFIPAIAGLITTLGISLRDTADISPVIKKLRGANTPFWEIVDLYDKDQLARALICDAGVPPLPELLSEEGEPLSEGSEPENENNALESESNERVSGDWELQPN